MFKAIWRYIKAFGYLITGRINQARQSLSLNPHVIEASYDEITETKTSRVQQLKGAVARLVAQKQDKVHKLEQLTSDIKKQEALKLGAASKAKKVLASFGGNIEDARKDADYIKCETAFKDFSSTLKEKEERAVELEDSIDQLTNTIEEHKINLQSMVREIEKLKEEKSTAVSEVISAREEEEIADMINGIAADDTNKLLGELRETRNQAKARAKVSRELAGVDAKKEENEYLAYAESNEANAEFEQMLGLAPPPAKLEVEVTSIRTNQKETVKEEVK